MIGSLCQFIDRQRQTRQGAKIDVFHDFDFIGASIFGNVRRVAPPVLSQMIYRAPDHEQPRGADDRTWLRRRLLEACDLLARNCRAAEHSRATVRRPA